MLATSYSGDKALAVTADGSLVAMRLPDDPMSVGVWHVAERSPVGAPISVTELAARDVGPVQQLAFAPDGRTLVLTSDLGPVFFVDPTTGTARRHRSTCRKVAASAVRVQLRRLDAGDRPPRWQDPALRRRHRRATRPTARRQRREHHRCQLQRGRLAARHDGSRPPRRAVAARWPAFNRCRARGSGRTADRSALQPRWSKPRDRGARRHRRHPRRKRCGAALDHASRRGALGRREPRRLAGRGERQRWRPALFDLDGTRREDVSLGSRGPAGGVLARGRHRPARSTPAAAIRPLATGGAKFGSSTPRPAAPLRGHRPRRRAEAASSSRPMARRSPRSPPTTSCTSSTSPRDARSSPSSRTSTPRSPRSRTAPTELGSRSASRRVWFGRTTLPRTSSWAPLLEGDDAGVFGVAYSPDGQLVAGTALGLSTTRLWATDGGAPAGRGSPVGACRTRSAPSRSSTSWRLGRRSRRTVAAS